MPKSKSKRRSSGKGGAVGRPETSTNRLALLALGLAVVAGGAWFWTGRQSDEAATDGFVALVEAGQPALARVRSIPSQGNGHLAPGQSKTYAAPFPTSGDHAGQGIRAGFYETEQPKPGLVHALEHGNVVIYYDTPGDEAIARLRDWTSRFKGPWSGVVATRFPGLGKELVLTAWTRSLRLNSFDAAQAAAFVDAFRGRGPENPVR